MYQAAPCKYCPLSKKQQIKQEHNSLSCHDHCPDYQKIKNERSDKTQAKREYYEKHPSGISFDILSVRAKRKVHAVRRTK